jgi:hypothetical protein
MVVCWYFYNYNLQTPTFPDLDNIITFAQLLLKRLCLTRPKSRQKPADMPKVEEILRENKG